VRIIRRNPVTRYVSSPQAGLPVNSIFISYRRKTAGHIAGSLHYILESELGKHVPFRDLESIAAGEDFRQTIIKAISESRVFILLIDPSWHTEAGRQRLREPGDYIRLEVATALAKGPSLRIIPVRIDGAFPLQQEDLPTRLENLAHIQSIELGEGEHFSSSVERIVQRIRAPV